MNLVQVRADSLSVPNYYLIMFRNNPNAIDLFSINQPNLTDSLDIQLIARKEVFPRSTSFRMGVGLRIVDINSIEVFSVERHINRKSIIEIFGNK